MFIHQMMSENGEREQNDIESGKLKNSEKYLPQCHFSITNPTWSDPGANPGLRGERLSWIYLVI
jgi:hypothetical protein